MRLHELNQIRKLYFGHQELARVLGITHDSARVAASRYVRQGILVRIKRNLYILKDTWKHASLEEIFQIANMVQVPSYISLVTALDYYGLTTQIQRDFFESIALKRTKESLIHKTVFKYTKISRNLYFGFQRQKNFFIAKPEKALLDAFYLMSLGRYSLDLSAIEFNRVDQEQLDTMRRLFPQQTQKVLQTYGFITTA